MKMSKHAGLAQQNGFSLGVLQKLIKKALQSLTFAKEECNKYDLIDTPCFFIDQS
jgi:hypothetical protein